MRRWTSTGEDGCLQELKHVKSTGCTYSYNIITNLVWHSMWYAGSGCSSRYFLSKHVAAVQHS
jgi:hypothetical protein